MAKKLKRLSGTERACLAACDEELERAAMAMIETHGATLAVVIDRMLTYAAAQACTQQGSDATAVVFEVLAKRIRGGLFHHLTGEGAPRPLTRN